MFELGCGADAEFDVLGVGASAVVGTQPALGAAVAGLTADAVVDAWKKGGLTPSPLTAAAPRPIRTFKFKGELAFVLQEEKMRVGVEVGVGVEPEPGTPICRRIVPVVEPDLPWKRPPGRPTKP